MPSTPSTTASPSRMNWVLRILRAVSTIQGWRAVQSWPPLVRSTRSWSRLKHGRPDNYESRGSRPAGDGRDPVVVFNADAAAGRRQRNARRGGRNTARAVRMTFGLPLNSFDLYRI